MMVQATQDEGVDSGIPTDSQQTPITTQPSSSRPQKKQSKRKQRKETKVPQDETHPDDSVPIPSNDPLFSAKDAQAKEIAGLKKRGRLDDVEMFDIDDLHDDDEVFVDMVVGEKQEKSEKIDERKVSTGVKDSATPTIPVTTADEGVTAAKIDEITPTSTPTTVIDVLTLAQTLIKIKAAKPKAVTTTATTTTRPKARGVVVQEPSEFRTTTSSLQASQPSKTKDKGKAIMIEPEVPLKRKDQVALDEEMARNLEAHLQAELIEEEKMARKKEKEQEELTDEEKAKLFMEFMETWRKHFATLRAQEKRNRPPTKAQKRNQMSVYLKHIEVHEISGKKDESSSNKIEIAQDSSAKRAGDKLESDESKKQKTNENEEVEKDNEVELKNHLVIVKDDDIATDAIPLASKPPVIGIDKEDLETLWKLVETKHGNTRSEDEHERVLWGDLKIMFEPDIKSDVWRNLQGYKVTIWKLYDSCGLHFVSKFDHSKKNEKERKKSQQEEREIKQEEIIARSRSKRTSIKSKRVTSNKKEKNAAESKRSLARMLETLGSLTICEQGSNASLQCPKLTETDYTSWSILVETVLRAYGLWESIDPVTGATVDEKKNYTTKAIIFQTLLEDILFFGVKGNSPKNNQKIFSYKLQSTKMRKMFGNRFGFSI
ncbi:hypothetical protein Tco_0516640 [Tanacetum coccineum]